MGQPKPVPTPKTIFKVLSDLRKAARSEGRDLSSMRVEWVLPIDYGYALLKHSVDVGASGLPRQDVEHVILVKDESRMRKYVLGSTLYGLQVKLEEVSGAFLRDIEIN